MDQSSKNILLVDDEVGLLEIMGHSLEHEGYNVVKAQSGLEALEKLKSVNPDLIILDVNMPQMGGIEFYQKICGADNLPKYPILVLTARADLEELFKELNIDGFIAKPFQIDILLNEVKTIIQSKDRKSSSKAAQGLGRGKRICMVDNDSAIVFKLISTFVDVGYSVSLAKSGALGIERIANELPDIALIRSGLDDISGHMVVLKLKHMAKTKDVFCVLYRLKRGTNAKIDKKILEKKGIVDIVEYTDPEQLLKAVNEIYEKLKEP